MSLLSNVSGKSKRAQCVGGRSSPVDGRGPQGRACPARPETGIQEQLSPWTLPKGESPQSPPQPRPQVSPEDWLRGWLPTAARVCLSLWAPVQQASDKNPAEHPEPRLERDPRLSRHHRRGHAEEDPQVPARRVGRDTRVVPSGHF